MGGATIDTDQVLLLIRVVLGATLVEIRLSQDQGS
jgi:hypothetical protein